MTFKRVSRNFDTKDRNNHENILFFFQRDTQTFRYIFAFERTVRISDSKNEGILRWQYLSLCLLFVFSAACFSRNSGCITRHARFRIKLKRKNESLITQSVDVPRTADCILFHYLLQQLRLKQTLFAETDRLHNYEITKHKRVT